jgi:hypothetical protein
VGVRCGVSPDRMNTVLRRIFGPKRHEDLSHDLHLLLVGLLSQEGNKKCAHKSFKNHVIFLSFIGRVIKSRSICWARHGGNKKCIYNLVGNLK